MDHVRSYVSLKDLLTDLKIADDEGTSLELKTAKGGLPKSFWESYSAFSNTRGGYIIVGVDEKTFKPVEIDIDGRQKDIASTLEAKISPPIAPHIQIHILDGKKVLIIKVHKAEPHQKPVYVYEKGPKKGSYKRVGSSNINLSDDDLERIYVERSIQPPDSRPLLDFTLDAIDLEQVDKWRAIARVFRPTSRLIPLDSLKLLQRLKAVSYIEGQWIPNRGGLLLFGRQEYISSLFPGFEIQVVYVDGINWKPDISKRPSKVTFEGNSLLTLMTELEDFSYRLIPEAPIVTSGKFGRNEDPMHTALREAIINILIHQDYSAHRHAKIKVFTDRLEMENAGYSKKPVYLFDTLGSEIRNPVIAGAFEKCGWVEKEGTGIQTIKEAMKSLSMPEPAFKSDEMDNTFMVTFRWQNFVDRAILEWVNKLPDLKPNEREVLIIAKQMGKINNQIIRKKLGFSNDVVSRLLSKLSDQHYLRRERYDYYFQEHREVRLDSQRSHGPLFDMRENLSSSHVGASASGTSPTKPPIPQSKPPIVIPQTPHQIAKPPMTLGGNSGEPPIAIGGSRGGIGGSGSSALSQLIPRTLLTEISQLPKKVPREKLQQLIYVLCQIQPFSKAELAHLFQRSEDQIRNNGIRPLLKSGKLTYTEPDNLRSENQKYISRSTAD